MALGVTFNQSNASLIQDDIRDVVTDEPLVLKELLEECLAKYLLMSLWKRISSVFDDCKVFHFITRPS